MSIFEKYTQSEIDMMSEEVIQAHKDVDRFRDFIKKLPANTLNRHTSGERTGLNIPDSVKMDYMIVGKGKFNIGSDL